MRTFRHPALAVFVLVHLSPTLAWGQAEKVGIVTTLEGNVTARRAVLPLPVPLKFKDDVFFRDTITTGDQSLARVLLGGKSIVTVRERSVVTITESPGRSFISLESGKIGLAVARERMAPGESVDVRTPNAVVVVRGTVIVAEVTCPVVRTEACPAAATNLFMLRGSGEVRQLDPTTGVQIGPPVTLNAMQQFKAAGTTAQVTPISPSQVGQINAGLEGKGIQHKEAANQEQVKTQVAQATNAVLGALLGGSGGGALVGGGWPVIILPPPPPPPPPPTPYKQNQLTTETVAGAAIVRPQLTIPGNAFQVETDPPNITINPALAQFAAALAAAPIPVVMIPAGGVSTGPVPANLDRPLFQATGSNLT